MPAINAIRRSPRRQPKWRRTSTALRLRRLGTAAFLAAVFALLFAQMSGRAAPGDPINTLPYTKGFLVTGDYVIGGVDLNENDHPIVNGFSTGTIHIRETPCPPGQQCDVVPANADVIAAYLFWETITIADNPLTPLVDESVAPATGVKFRGNDIDITDVWTVNRSSTPESSTTPCWSSGDPLTRHIFRADVLRFLPMLLDKDDYETGRFLVNDSDLVANGFPLHTVTLPVTIGNEDPESAGASLLVVYRDLTEPLRKIVIYDGIYTQPNITVPMEQTLQGFYLSSTAKSAKFTHITASGQPNQNDKITFESGAGTGLQQQVFSDPFAAGSASQRAWANPTYDVSSLMQPGTNSGVYGETVTTRTFHQPTNGGNDCLTWGAVVFSTAVADEDPATLADPHLGDGLPDGLEDASGVMKDPDGKDLPKLKAMGAGSDQKDIFVEVNAMEAGPGTSYGSATAPYDSTNLINTVTDANGHHHVPTPADLKMVGDAFAAKGIRPHFDVGNVANYHALGVVQHSDWVDDYGQSLADQYLVGNGLGLNISSLARGGEIITETACVFDPVNNPSCHFPDFPGTVLWKVGLQSHRDAMVRDDGTELTYEQLTDPTEPGYFNWSAGTKRRRFDTKRKGLFRYLLYAHSRGMPKSLPCLEDGHPAPYDAVDQNGVGSCLTGPNPNFKLLDYHVPSSASGIADLPGGDLLVTLGLWDEFVGRPFPRAGTTFHELGHNLELWHGGLPATLGSKALNTATEIEPNCKPNHLSSMSYLFQVHGLFDDDDTIHLDYSGAQHGNINEGTTLFDGVLSPPASYQPAWFAPAGSQLALNLGVSPATRFCSGEKFDPAAPPAPMARVYAATKSSPIDWDGDLLTGSGEVALLNQDVNFDSTLNSAPNLLNGFNDWANIRLDQIGAVPTGALPGSLEGLDDASIIFWNGGGLIGSRGGVVWNQAGLIGSRGGLVGGRGGLVGGRGGSTWHEGGLVGGRGGLVGGRGGLVGGRGGLVGGRGGDQEIDSTIANDLGKTRPYALKVCVIGTPGCSAADPSTPEYHRVEGTFNAPPFGDFSDYEVQRKRAAASDTTFVTIPNATIKDPVTLKPTNRFRDLTELADGVEYAYRVRGVAADGNTGWTRATPNTVIEAVNDAPEAAPDGVFQVSNKSVLNGAVLGNDLDDDSPTAFRARRAILVSGPAVGTLRCGASGPSPAICADGTFRYTPPKGSFLGEVTFTYKADDGLSNDSHSPQVPLSGFSDTVTVTINVFKP